MARLTLQALHAMKRDGRKIVGVVAWDTPTAQILDRAGVDLVSVGDSVGVNLWGRDEEGDATLDELLVLCRAVRRGVHRALVSCDLPAPLGADAAKLLAEAGADVVKADDPAVVPELVAAGVPVFAQLSGAAGDGDELVAEARRLEAAGASLLDFRHSGPDHGPKVVAACAIPVVGGLGGGPWLDGRVRMIHRATGYDPAALDTAPDAYANLAQATYDAIAAYADDVRAGRQIRGG